MITPCRPSAFQELCHPESTYLEKALTAQLTRIDAADRLFSVPLTRITSVPECAVSSVGFLWGSATVSQACGASVGLAETLICPAFPIHGARVPRLPEVTQRHRSGLPAGVDSAPEDRITDRYHVLDSRGDASLSPCWSQSASRNDHSGRRPRSARLADRLFSELARSGRIASGWSWWAARRAR